MTLKEAYELKKKEIFSLRIENITFRNSWIKPLRACSLRREKRIWKGGFVISKTRSKLWSTAIKRFRKFIK